MAIFQIPNVKVAGVSACVPVTVDRNRDSNLHTPEEMEKVIASIGVEEKRICDAETTTSDLCFSAAERLIADLGWDKSEITGLIFVSQTPDYILPATSCILQDRLGLPKDCFAIDISLGCSGWVYGFNTLSAIVSTGAVRKALLLVGDTPSKNTSRYDKSAWPLFGDAGTAMALEYSEDASPIVFNSNTDGSGYAAVIIPDGGCRNGITHESLEYFDIPDDGGKKTRLNGNLEGMDIFAFAISKAPKSVKKVLETVGAQKEDIDYYLFHQANLFLNETIRKKLKLEEAQVPYNISKYGNTSCAAIPLLMVTELKNELESRKLNLIGCAFGVGLSWNTVYFETNQIIVPQLIEYGQ